MNLRPSRVVLRADASASIGFGHLKRSLSLATALRSVGLQPCLITRALGVDSAGMARNAGIDVLMLPSPTGGVPAGDVVPNAALAAVDWHDDAMQTLAALCADAPAWVIVDHYAFDARWHRLVAHGCGARIAVIDDLADRELAGELLVDQNLHANHRLKYAVRWPAKRPLLGGPRYALLDESYARMQPAASHETVRSIGIFMGGTDPAGLTSVALRACREEAGFAGPVEIIASRAQPQLPELLELANQWPLTTVRCDLPSLAGFFAGHDLQIGAGGGASWERCRAGVPTLALIGAANQQEVIPALAAHGAVATLEGGVPQTVSNIGREVKALLHDASRRRLLGTASATLVDGMGCTRVAIALALDRLKLRDARPADAEPAFAWRNHADTRRFIRDPRPLELASHCAWWMQTLKMTERKLFIAHVGNRDVGVLRLDFADTAAEVSIYVNPALSGLGLGPAMLKELQGWVQLNTRGQIRLEAEIFTVNRASQKVFTRAGFVQQTTKWVWEPKTFNINQPPEESGNHGDFHVQDR